MDIAKISSVKNVFELVGVQNKDLHCRKASSRGSKKGDKQSGCRKIGSFIKS